MEQEEGATTNWWCLKVQIHRTMLCKHKEDLFSKWWVKVCVCENVCLCVGVRMCVECICVCIWMWVCVCMFLTLCVCVCVCVCACEEGICDIKIMLARVGWVFECHSTIEWISSSQEMFLNMGWPDNLWNPDITDEECGKQMGGEVGSREAREKGLTWG